MPRPTVTTMTDATKPKGYTWTESYAMCEHGVCKWHAFDMDGAYCTHAESFRIAPTFGASTNRMISEGLCTGCYDDPAKNHRQLFEPCEKKSP